MSGGARATAVRRPTAGGLAERLRHLPSGLYATGALLVLGAAAGAVVQGLAGAAGVALGVVLVAASFTGSSVAIAWADRINPRLVMPVGLMTYVVKFAALGVAAAALAASGWAGLPAFGLGIVAGTLGWVTAQAVWTWRAKIPYVDV